MWVETTQRHLTEFGNIKYRYFEHHDTKNGRVVNKCINSWDCDCKKVLYQTKKLHFLERLLIETMHKLKSWYNK